VAETFDIQPRQHPPGHPGLLRLVFVPASTSYVATGVRLVNKVRKTPLRRAARYLRSGSSIKSSLHTNIIFAVSDAVYEKDKSSQLRKAEDIFRKSSEYTGILCLLG